MYSILASINLHGNYSWWEWLLAFFIVWFIGSELKKLVDSEEREEHDEQTQKEEEEKGPGDTTT